jgi:hypothetical protein
VLRRWRSEHPDDRRPVEIAASLPTEEYDPEIEALRAVEGAGTPWDEERRRSVSLRALRRFLLADYRATRSAFFVLPAASLEHALELLGAMDSANARIYGLERAELAYDRRDDRRCIDLGLWAFTKVSADDANWNLDPDLRADSVARMAESAARLEGPEAARNVLRRGAAYSSSLLDFTRRKYGVSPEEDPSSLGHRSSDHASPADQTGEPEGPPPDQPESS